MEEQFVFTPEELAICTKLILYMRKEPTGKAVVNWTPDYSVLEPLIRIKFPRKRLDKTSAE